MVSIGKGVVPRPFNSFLFFFITLFFLSGYCSAKARYKLTVLKKTVTEQFENFETEQINKISNKTKHNDYQIF